MRIQDHAETWVIGDYTMHVTHFENDDYYDWTVTYSPMGYSIRGQHANLETAIREMLDTAEKHTGQVLTLVYHFDMPGKDVDIECTPQTTVRDAFKQVLSNQHGQLAHIENWSLESTYGIPIDNLDLHIGVFDSGITASTQPSSI